MLKDCHGNGWKAQSNVHFFSGYHVRSVTAPVTDDPGIIWDYWKKVDGVRSRCGPHDNPSQANIDNVIQAHDPPTTRDFATYYTGQGYKCYDMYQTAPAAG